MAQPSTGVAQGASFGIFAFRLWGRFSATRLSDLADITPRSRKARALLAHLLIDPGPVSRERLAGLLWSERAQPQAQASLRQCLQELRDFAPLLGVGRQHIIGRPGLAQTDLDEMMSAAASGEAGPLAMALDDATTGLLDDLDGIDPAFDEWLRPTRAARTERLIAAAAECVRTALDQDRVEPASELANALVRLDPLDEAIARLAMETALRAGKQDAIRRIYNRLRERLHAELDIVPSAETETLHARLVGGVVEADRAVGSSADSRSLQDRPTAPEGAARADAPSPGILSWQSARSRPLWRRWGLAATLLLVLLIAAAALIVPRLTGGAAAEPTSLAVLPFRNLTEGDDHFADGLAEEILTQLAREPQLRVAGRTSSWLFKDAADLRDVGRRLDVAYVLEGSVRRAGDNVRVDVALVGTRDGMRLWSHAFRGRLDDIFAIQDEIGREVAGALRLRFARAGPPAPAMRTSGEVHSLYLTARGLIRTRDPDNLRTASSLLRRAIRLDPNYAPAWSSLAQAIRLVSWTDPTARNAEAMRHVNRALALAPQLAEAHAVKGLLLGLTPAAARELERAVALDPNHVEAWHWLANVRGGQGDMRGTYEASRRVAQLDPFWINADGFAGLAWDLGQRAQAIQFEQNLAARHPEASHRELAQATIANSQGDWSAAALHLRRAVELDRGDSASHFRYELEPFLVMLDLPPEKAGHMAEFQQAFGREVVELWYKVLRGELPPRARIERALRQPRNFWEMLGLNQAATRLFLSENRSADLLYFYDATFESPEAMATGEYFGFTGLAPSVALALRQAGRQAEAERLLALAERQECRSAAPLSTSRMVLCSRILAVQGKREQAIAAFRRAVARGWPNGFLPDGSLWLPRPAISEDPAWAAIRDDPHFQRIDAALRAQLARERRELIAAWPELVSRPAAQ